MTAWSGDTVRKARARWKERLPLPCWHCKRPVLPDHPWVVEHIIPRSLGGDLTDVNNQWVSHRICSDRSGSKVAAARRPARPSKTRLEERTIPW